MRTSSRLLIALVVLIGGLLIFPLMAAGAPVSLEPSQPRHFVPPPRTAMRVSMDVLVDGTPMRTIHHQGKTYLPVPRWGVEYAIRVTNHGPRRIAAMVSVDGLSVINGKPASEHQPGYIVAPYSQIVIKGWRTSMDSVAAFSFEERGSSYASRVGRPENIGVIGLIAVEEQGDLLPMLEKRDSAAPHSGLRAADVGGTGTGYGRDIDSRIYYVPFVRSNNQRTITMYYDTVAALRRAGVPVDGPWPSPFPGDYHFVPPPPGVVR